MIKQHVYDQTLLSTNIDKPFAKLLQCLHTQQGIRKVISPPRPHIPDPNDTSNCLLVLTHMPSPAERLKFSKSKKGGILHFHPNSLGSVRGDYCGHGDVAWPPSAGISV